MASSPAALPHIVLFPFLSKGHTIPLLHLAHLLYGRRLASVTLLTTPLNAAFIREFLADTDTTIVTLPFPQDPPGIPKGVESTDQLPSMSLFCPFVDAVRLLQPQFEQAIKRLPPVSFLISDGFFGWTNASASKFGIPRVVFYGMGNFALTTCVTLTRDRPHAELASDDEAFYLSGIPNLAFTKADFTPPFDDPNSSGPLHEFVIEAGKATRGSHGIIVNSFYELESAYFEKWNAEFAPKAWCIGPLCLAAPHSKNKSELMEWLDSRLAMNRPVIYIAFGSQAEVSSGQVQKIREGFDQSEIDFLWVVRSGEPNLSQWTPQRGKVVSEWVNQREILAHESIRGFLSHCGWNSVMEGVCAGVPILAWPMAAEQHLNAKLVVELGIGMRVRSCDGTRDGLVKAKEIEEMIKNLVRSEKGKEAEEKARGFAEAARKTMSNGGSSWCSLESMIHAICNTKERITSNVVD